MTSKDAFDPSNYGLDTVYDINATQPENVYALSEKIMNIHKFHSQDTAKDASLYMYGKNTGVWSDGAENLIRSLLREAIPSAYKTYLANEVIGSIRTAVYSTSIDITNYAPIDKIVCANGVLNLTTSELTDFNPEEYHITRIPVTYDPDATSPNFTKFLGEVTRNENDRLTLEEIIGYGLFRQYTYEMFVFLVGEGANGKDIFMSVLEAFYSVDNVSYLGLGSMMKSPFLLGNLFNKLVNLAGDVRDKTLLDPALLKRLTGASGIEADRKFKDTIKFTNSAKMIFTTNKIPETDPDNAFYRRFEMVAFPNVFEPTDENYIPRGELLALLTTEQELSGLLNLALAGWQRLRINHQLTNAVSTKESREIHQLMSDPALYFMENLLYNDPDAEPIEKRVLYKCYVDFCREHKKTPVADSTFGKKVFRYVDYAEERKINKINCWVGIGYNYEGRALEQKQQEVLS